MIHIVTAHNRAAHFHTLERMFEDRKRLFVDLLGWDVPVVSDRYEIDQFDGPDAVYLVALDEGGAHQGSLRLLPTLQPHILDTLFAPLCVLDVPRGAHVWEITRLCLPARLGAATRLSVRNALISVMIDYALASGITRLTGVVADRFRKEVLSMGWLAEPLGPALRLGGNLLGAFAIHLAPNAPDRLAWTGIYRSDTAMAPCARAAA